MKTIDAIAKLDRIQLAIYALLERGLAHLQAYTETKIIDAAHSVAEKASLKISKAEDRVEDAEDRVFEVNASYDEAQRVLAAKYHEALLALRNERARQLTAAEGGVASAAMALVAAEKEHDATIKEIFDKLQVTIEAR